MTIVSFSEAMTFQSCKRQNYYKFGLGLSPVEESNAITTGVNGHKLLEIFYKAMAEGLTKEKAIAKMAHSVHHDDLSPEMLKPYFLVKNYLTELDLTNIETIFVEKSFKVPLADRFDLHVGFTPDLVLLWYGRKLLVEDYKFVGRAWTKNKLSRFSQLNLYNLFLTEAGYEINKAILRFFNITTNKIEYKLYDPSDDERRILRHDFLKVAIEIQEFKERPVAEQNIFGTRTFNYNTCQYCPFVFPCTLEAQGKDASKTLATQYKENQYGYEQ